MKTESVSCSVMSNSLQPLGLYTVHEIFQVRTLEWVAISFSRGSSWPRDQTGVSQITGRFFSVWTTWEAPTCLSANHIFISCQVFVLSISWISQFDVLSLILEFLLLHLFSFWYPKQMLCYTFPNCPQFLNVLGLVFGEKVVAVVLFSFCI